MVKVERPRKLFVGGLSIQSNEKTLERVFGKFAPLREGLIKEGARNKSRGFAFITLENPEDATDAVKEMNGKECCHVGERVMQAFLAKRQPLPGEITIYLQEMMIALLVIGCTGGAPSTRGPPLTYGGRSRWDEYYSLTRNGYDWEA